MPTKIQCPKCQKNKSMSGKQRIQEEQVPSAPMPRNIIDQLGDFSNPFRFQCKIKPKNKSFLAGVKIFSIEFNEKKAQAQILFAENENRFITIDGICSMADVPCNSANMKMLGEMLGGRNSLYIDLENKQPVERTYGSAVVYTTSKKQLVKGMRKNKKLISSIVDKIRAFHLSNTDLITADFVNLLNNPALPF